MIISEKKAQNTTYRTQVLIKGRDPKDKNIDLTNFKQNNKPYIILN